MSRHARPMLPLKGSVESTHSSSRKVMGNNTVAGWIESNYANAASD